MRSIRRRVSAVAVATLAASGLLLGAVAPAAQADVEQPTAFGLHVPQIANGFDPTASYGSIRIWDVGVTWGKVQQSEKKFWWTGLDRAINNARAQNLSVLYVLGSTPTWAAKNPKQGTYPNRGAASMPKDIKLWRNWVTAVVKRYKAQVDAWQIWNEANLSTFWQGTPEQMAQLTAEAAKIIRKYDPTAQIVSASTTVRLEAAFNKFEPKYLAALKKKGWPVTVYSVHSYPQSTGTPKTRADYVNQFKATLAAAGAPAKPIWDTEVNYGLAGPGPSNPKQNIDGDQAASWVAQTYLDSARLGVDRTYWYSYTPTPYPLLGIQLVEGSAGAQAYNRVYGWLAGADVSCSTGPINTCAINKNGQLATVVWASEGEGAYTVAAGATTSVTAAGVSTPVTAGQSVTIGTMPTWFGAS